MTADDFRDYLERLHGRLHGTPTRAMYYDPDGNPLTLMEWADLFAERHHTEHHQETWWRRTTRINNELAVSTIWLGLDHGIFSPVPLIWETMIFGDGHEHDEAQWRYPNRAAAYDHHEEIVRALRNGEEPPDPGGDSE